MSQYLFLLVFAARLFNQFDKLCTISIPFSQTPKAARMLLEKKTSLQIFFSFLILKLSKRKYYSFFVPIIFAKMCFLHSADKEKSLSFQRCSMISSSNRRARVILFASVYVSFDQHPMLLQFSKLWCNKMRLIKYNLEFEYFATVAEQKCYWSFWQML